MEAVAVGAQTANKTNYESWGGGGAGGGDLHQIRPSLRSRTVSPPPTCSNLLSSSFAASRPPPRPPPVPVEQTPRRPHYRYLSILTHSDLTSLSRAINPPPPPPPPRGLRTRPCPAPASAPDLAAREAFLDSCTPERSHTVGSLLLLGQTGY